MKGRYQDVAAFYQAMVPADTLLGRTTANPVMAQAAAALPDGAHVLDATCGAGWDAIAISNGLPGITCPPKRLTVCANDGSEHMIAQARLNAAGFFGPSCPDPIDFRQNPLSDLGQQADWQAKFDLIIVPNAIVTLNDMDYAGYDDYLIAAFQGVRSVLKPEGQIIVDTRDWEKTLAKGLAVTQRVNSHGGRSYLAEYVWKLGPREDGPHFARMTIWDNPEKTGPGHAEDIRFAGKSIGAIRGLFERAGLTIETETPQVRGRHNEPFITFSLRPK